MITKIIEATQPEHLNWGKFMVCRFDEAEWKVRSGLAEVARQVTNEQFGEGVYEEHNAHGMNPVTRPLLAQIGWTPQHIWVLDLQTGEGAAFMPGGVAKYDLDKHKVWVCPMFEPFLNWLYKQDLTDITKPPSYVEIDGEFSLAGYRRKGE